jgi:hypothetical protein
MVDMMKILKLYISFIIIPSTVLISAFFCNAFGQETEISKTEPFEIIRIYADRNGESHFGKTNVTFKLINYAPPAQPISVSEVQATEGIVFISSPAGWYGDWHPAPRKQLMFCLTGELEVKESDGEIHRFGPGCAILVEDTSGKGHISRVVGSESCYMAAIPFKVLDE